MKNILFEKRTRKKFKTWKQLRPLFTKPYYELDEIPLKEKCYTFFYWMEKTGYTTQGEIDWSKRMMKLDFNMWDTMEKLFKSDYKDYLLQAGGV